MSNDVQSGGDSAPMGSRGPEVAVALLLMAIGGLVVVDALRAGIGWADDGPRAGYFPFYVGLMLLGASLWILVSQLLAWRQRNEPFADRSQLASVLAVLLPMGVYVGLIAPIGIYLASALLIGWFMWRHGKHAVATTAAIAVGLPLAFFLVFERWFLVPLPKGPIERMLGF